MELEGLLLPAAAALLRELPLREPDRFRRLLGAFAHRLGEPRESGPLLDQLLSLLAEGPDSEMALLNLERWSAALASPRSTLHLLSGDPRPLEDLLRLVGSSQYFADVLVRDPWLYSMLLEPDPPPVSAGRIAEEIDAALRPHHRPDARRDALRRVKRRLFLRIGWRDICRGAPVPETAREISDAAEALIRAALSLSEEEVAPRFRTAAAQVSFAVVAMGKLGARELNYSSDVDLLFVMDTPGSPDDAQRRYATRLAETLIAVLSENTAEGRCFRVDMRLRPEGRFGALVRTLSAFRTYYDRWAETWERQALIKARPVAGCPELGERFLSLIRPVVYRRVQGAAVLDDVREMRLAVESRLDAAGEMGDHVKAGRGTIRDVEFPVQLLQLLFGADVPALQVRDTWSALAALEEASLLTPQETGAFRSGYDFFRQVEHRLQVMHDLPVRRLPSEPDELRRLARSMGLADEGDFRRIYEERSGAVRAAAEQVHARLGVRARETGGAMREAVLVADLPEGQRLLREELSRRGFPDPEVGLAALRRLAIGPPGYPHPSATRRLFADLAGGALDASGRAADPGRALEGLADYADRKLVHRSLYRTFLEHPESLAAVCLFAGGAPRAMEGVLRHPELADAVTDPARILHPLPRESMVADLRQRLAETADHDHRMTALRRWKLLQFVRLAARLIVAGSPVAEVTREWSEVAQTALGGALETAVRRLVEQSRWPETGPGEFAVLALGRMGGRELHFGSDLDLLYVFDGEGGDARARFELLARTLGEVLGTVTEDGRLWEVDLRLRPEGRQGFSVASLAGLRRYYGEGGRAQTWEFQMLTRLRYAAGSAPVAAAATEILSPRVYRDPMPESWPREIWEMRLRMERERVPPEQCLRHLKLGPGGLADIEFLLQLLQLRHGGARPELRELSPRSLLRRMEAAGLLSRETALRLEEGLDFLTSLRLRLALLGGEEGADLLPEADDFLARPLARSMSVRSFDELQERHRALTGAIRAALQGWVMGDGL